MTDGLVRPLAFQESRLKPREGTELAEVAQQVRQTWDCSQISSPPPQALDPPTLRRTKRGSPASAPSDPQASHPLLPQML